MAIDVPYLSLWHDVPGAQVVWGGHDAGYPRASRPAGLLREIDARFGVHPAFLNDFDCPWQHEPSINALADALIVGARRRLEIIDWLLGRHPRWGLFMTVLSEAHSAGEHFWHGMAAAGHPLAATRTAPLARRRLLETYRELDQSLARILQMMPPETTVMVCTVHGMEANDHDVPSMGLLPELLYRACTGRVLLRSPGATAWRRRGCPAVVPAGGQIWNDYVRERFGRGLWRQRWDELRRKVGRGRRQKCRSTSGTPIPPETDQMPAEIGEPRWRLNWQPPCWYRAHWPRMRAFALPVFYDGRVRINLRGRERDGIVDPADYEKTCGWVERLLADCRDPRTGEPAVANVERLRADDPMRMDGPDADLVITWSPAVDALEHPVHGLIGPLPFRRTGGHSNRGFAYLAGPGIAPRDLGEQEALDLTPTLLALFGQPAPQAIRWAA